jgi:hypothetical protein
MSVSNSSTAADQTRAGAFVAGDSLFGSVTFYSSRAGGFTDDQANLVQLLAPHVAQAIRGVSRREAPAPAAKAGHELRLVSAR